MNEWKEYYLYELAEKFIDYRGKTPEKTIFGIPLITAKIVKNGAILQPNEFISKDNYSRWMTRGLPKINDVVLTTEAPLGEVALINNENVALAQRIILIRGKDNKLNNIFLKYYLQSNIGQEELDRRSSGTTVTGIKSSELKKIKIRCPNYKYQCDIASVLIALDRKIDTIHRQNATLEKMAETLFRQWFIVEAKDDWDEGKILDIVNVKSGFPFKSSSFVEDGIFKLVTIKAVQDGYLTLNNADSIQEIPDNVKDYCFLNKGDILLSLTGNVGRCCLVDRDNLILNQRVSLLQPIEQKNWAFIYTLFRMESMKSILEETAKGTAQPNLSPVELSNMPFIIPPDELLNLFSLIVTPLIKKILSNRLQIYTLERLRDTLLPKLMSGEIRVKCDREAP